MESSKTGVILDNRDEFERSKDYLHEEIAMGFEPYLWEERPAKSKYFYPYNQSTSLSCVAGGAGIILEFYDGNVISRRDVYQRRLNYPQGGMMMNDVLDIMSKGAALESTVLSQGQGETVMNTRYPVTAQILKERDANRTGKYFTITNRTIDEIAKVVKVCPVIGFWYFDEAGKEWWTEYPVDRYGFTSYVQAGVTRHQVAIVDAILINGKKYLVGQDTAGVGTGLGENNNIRLISEDMVTKRLYAAGYALDDDNDILKPNSVLQPKYDVTATLQIGSKGPDVVALQNVLIFEGLLNIKTPTGVFAGMTRAAVIKLQEKYSKDILVPVGLKKGTGIVANATNNFLRNKYK